MGSGAAWASGFRLYAVVFFAGLLSRLHWLVLPGKLEILTNPWVMGFAGVLALVEFLADKIPAVDSAWDAAHTFIRIPAGALLAAAALGDAHPGVIALAGLAGMGAWLVPDPAATTSHTAKASGRALVNTSPEPFSNIATSVAEEVTVVGGLWLAVAHPILFSIFLAAFLIVSIWFTAKMWSLFRRILRKFSTPSGPPR